MGHISRKRLGEFVQTALRILQENDGQLPSREVTRQVGDRIEFNSHELELLKSGSIRWENALHWYSVDTTKAGWLIKKGGVWYLTPEGEEALNLPPDAFIETANQAYRKWKIKQDDLSSDECSSDKIGETITTTFEQAEGLAIDQIHKYILNLDAYEFQDLIAALLHAMGYFTPFVAPRGRDGGIDIVAYRDPLGTLEPRIKVQVKHRQNKATAQEIRELAGVLKEGDVGLFVSSGGFTSDAIAGIRNSQRHIEKLDFEAVVELWQEHYDELEEEDKALLPLRKIMFLSPDE